MIAVSERSGTQLAIGSSNNRFDLVEVVQFLAVGGRFLNCDWAASFLLILNFNLFTIKAFLVLNRLLYRLGHWCIFVDSEAHRLP